jgi:maltose-binding protein MalE
MYVSYLHKYPNNKPQFTFMTNESDALGKIQSGQKFDLFRPYVGWVEYFAASGLVEPWDPSLISNFPHLNPFMVKAGQYQGKQYGLRRHPLPQRQGQALDAVVGAHLR